MQVNERFNRFVFRAIVKRKRPTNVARTLIDLSRTHPTGTASIRGGHPVMLAHTLPLA